MASKVDRSTLIRRGFHLTSPLWLIWYWMPQDSWIGVRKEAVLVSILCVALVIEAARLLTGRRILGFRADESERISSYAWGSLGLAFGLFFFPGEIVIVTFWGMAWIDPLCALARKKGWYRGIPILAYAALFLAVEAAMEPFLAVSYAWSTRVLFAVLATATAIPLEGRKVPQLDDDFLMLIVPMVVLAFAAWILAPLRLL